MLSPIKLLLAASVALAISSGCTPTRTVKGSAQTGHLASSAQLDASSTVAVMLPFSGKYEKASAAIRNGIELTNNLVPREQRPQLLFLNSGEGITGAVLQQAASAEIMIGPLSREGVTQVLQMSSGLPRTTIALNHVDNLSPLGVYQFGLSPDEDARQIAQKAFSDGHRTASVLYPSAEWGSRHLEGFRHHWTALGGSIAATVSYPLGKATASKDKKNPISEAVKAVLQSSGDFVYVVGKPRKARELRTFLLYHGNIELPAYISSRAYDRRLFSHDSGDLTGAWLAAMPISIPDQAPPQNSTSGQTAAPTIISNRSIPTWSMLESTAGFSANYASFYALGIDAMRLALNAYRLEPYSMVEGASGNLYSDEYGVIRRQPAWLYYGDELTITPPSMTDHSSP